MPIHRFEVMFFYNKKNRQKIKMYVLNLKTNLIDQLNTVSITVEVYTFLNFQKVHTIQE